MGIGGWLGNKATQVFQPIEKAIVQPIGRGLADVDKAVHNNIPGGWATVGAAALLVAVPAMSAFPELLAAADAGTLTSEAIASVGFSPMSVLNSVTATIGEAAGAMMGGAASAAGTIAGLGEAATAAIAASTGLSPALISAIGTGMASGAAIGGIKAAITGGNILQDALKGGLIGGATGGIVHGIGGLIGGADSLIPSSVIDAANASSDPIGYLNEAMNWTGIGALAAGGAASLIPSAASTVGEVGQALPYTEAFDAANMAANGFDAATIAQNIAATGVDPAVAQAMANAAASGLSEAAIDAAGKAAIDAGTSSAGQALPYTEAYDASNMAKNGYDAATIAQNLEGAGVNPAAAKAMAEAAANGATEAAIEAAGKAVLNPVAPDNGSGITPNTTVDPNTGVPVHDYSTPADTATQMGADQSWYQKIPGTISNLMPSAGDLATAAGIYAAGSLIAPMLIKPQTPTQPDMSWGPIAPINWGGSPNIINPGQNPGMSEAISATPWGRTTAQPNFDPNAFTRLIMTPQEQATAQGSTVPYAQLQPYTFQPKTAADYTPAKIFGPTGQPSGQFAVNPFDNQILSPQAQAAAQGSAVPYATP